MSLDLGCMVTSINDGRKLIEMQANGRVIASAACRPDEAGGLAMSIIELLKQAPALEGVDIASIVRESLKPIGIEPMSLAQMLRENPELREPVIERLLRRGEVSNLIASPKTGKSFLAGNLAWCIATGRDWLGFEVKQSPVLILDNELHPETLANRLDRIADAMMIDHADRGLVDVISLRGRWVDVDSIGSCLNIPANKYGLVVIDALYRWLPEGVSENDNSGMMRVYNRLDELAQQWGAALVVVHHSSKGDQSEKSVTDMGSGAGSISRAADTHLTIRPHRQDGLAVLEGVTRSFQPLEPQSIRFEYPIFHAVACPAELRTKQTSQQKSQEANDAEGKQKILDALPPVGRRIVQRRLRDKTGMGDARLRRLLTLLENDGKVTIKVVRRGGKGPAVRSVCRVGTEDGLDQASTD